MQVSIINNDNNNVSSTNDKLLIYYQSLSTRGDLFRIVSDYNTYQLFYDKDDNVERLLNYSNYQLMIHRVTDIDSSEIYISRSGESFDSIDYSSITINDIQLIDRTLPDDFWVILDFIYRTPISEEYQDTENSISYLFCGYDSNKDKEFIDIGGTYKFTTRGITTKTLLDIVCKSLDGKLFNDSDQSRYNIIGLYTRINDYSIRLINNIGIVCNYDIISSKTNVDPDVYSQTIKTKYAIYISNSTNQNIGISFNYDTYSSKYIVKYKLYDEFDNLLYTTDTRVSSFTDVVIDSNLTIELGEDFELLDFTIISGKEYKLHRESLFPTRDLYYDKLSELGELNSTFDIAIDPTMIDGSTNNSSKWATTLLDYKSTPVVLTGNYYNDPNIASFTPRFFTITDSDTRLPSYYLFLAMYPNRYAELVDKISFKSTDVKDSRSIPITNTEYGYEINNPMVVRSLNSMITIAHIIRLITNRTYTTMTEVSDYVTSLGCTILSYTSNTIHIRLIVDDIKRELNIEVTLNG
jgi:hypothetical protein